MSYENIIVELIVKGGDARSNALLAIRAAKEGNFSEAEKLGRDDYIYKYADGDPSGNGL